MRSIMDIARSEGEDIYSLETQLSCLQVFALGGNTKDDNGLETSYYSTRLGLSIALKGAGNFISKEGIQGVSKILMTSTHPMVKLIAIIASRFTVQVSEKFENLLALDNVRWCERRTPFLFRGGAVYSIGKRFYFILY